jgi:uncharacterized protein YfiM (DUF2279 family)
MTDAPGDSSESHGLVYRTETLSEPVRDAWFSQDKFLHFGACAAIPGLTYHLYVCRLNRDEHRGKIYSVSLTALAGVGKEIYDKKKNGHFSWKDLVWDGMGLIVGYLLFIHDF